MASNRVSVELNAQVSGFVDGMKQASESAKQYETDQRKVRDSLGSFRKEFSQAKKDVQNLALAYSKLDAAAKASTFGQEMKKQLDAAKESAAQLVDMQGDLQAELKNMASDTRVFDTMSEGLSVFMNTTSAALGVVAQFTGNEEDARRAVVMFTTAQSTLSAVTKIQNALQKQSNTMLAVGKIQTMAATAATKLKTAAEGKNVVVTKAATVAQKAFNAVAKMNPYLFLATALLSATGLVYAYIAATRKAESATSKLSKEMHAVSLQGRKDAQDDIVKLDILYRKTQDNSSAMNERIAAVKKLQSEYPAYFGNMSKEQILLGQASDKYKQLKEDIIAVAMAKAYEQKISDLAKENVEIEDQIEKQKKLRDQHKKAAEDAKNYAMNNYGAQGVAGVNTPSMASDKLNSKLAETNREIDENTKKLNANKEAIGNYIDKVNSASGAMDRLNKKEEKITKSGGSTSHTKKEVEAAIGSIAELENQISTLQDEAKKGILPKELRDPVEFQNKISELTRQVKELKIKWGFEKPKSKLEKLQEELENAKHEFEVAVEIDDHEAQQRALQAVYAAQRKLNEHKLKITIEPEFDVKKAEKERKDVNKIVNDALKTEDQSYDFSYLDEAAQAEADAAVKKYDKVKAAREKLTEIMNNENSTDAQIAAAQQGLESLNTEYENLNQKINEFDESNKILKKNQKHWDDVKKTIYDVGDAVSATGDLFSALGQVAEDEDLAVAGIIAKAIATVAMSYAQALASCKTWVEWLAFGISGAATMVSMIAQIKSATSGSYEQGGIIGGSSYHGDRLTARVNSGEMILNQRQQRNLFNLLDQDLMPQKGGTNVTVTGVVRGTDLMLVQKNTNKVRSKAGTQINF